MALSTKVMRSLIAVACFTTAVAPGVRAETPQPTAAPSPVGVSKTQAKVDPAARAILDKSLETYKSLKAFSATLTADRASGTIAWEKPDKFCYELAIKGRKSQIVHTAAASDGKTYTRLLPIDQKHYYSSPANPNTITDAASDSYVMIAQGAPTLASAPIVLQNYANALDSPKTKRDITLALDAPATVDGVPCDVIEISEELKESGSGTFVISNVVSIGHDDHLIRRVAADFRQIAPADAKHPVNQHEVEDYSNVRTPSSLPAATFAFSAPAGVTLGTPAELAAVKEDAQTYHDKRLVVGARPFEFQATDLDGRPVSLDQYKGKVLVLDFWATWCGPCREELPNVISTYKKFHKDGLDVVGISLDEDKSDLTDFLKQNKIPYQIVFDGKGWDNAVAQQYKVRAIPFALVVGRDGKIAAVDVRGPQLTSAVKKALAAD